MVDVVLRRMSYCSIKWVSCFGRLFMEEKCKNCVRICKWLDAHDQPASYQFAHLSPQEILDLIEQSFRRQTYGIIAPTDFARSQGNQLAMMFTPVSAKLSSSRVTLIAQCLANESGAVLWFRFGVDDELCSYADVMDEFHKALNTTLNGLNRCDSLIHRVLNFGTGFQR